MAVIQGTVVKVSLEADVKKRDGGTYKAWQLIYTTADGEVRNIAKPVQGLRFNEALKNGLASLSAGDDFTLVQEKNETTGFNEVKSIEKGHTEVTTSVAAPSGSKPRTNGGYAQRDYETKDERAARQRLIVRQSTLAQAVAILSVGAKNVKVEDVKKLANDLTDFIFEENVEKQAPEIEDLEDDIPY